MQSAKIMTLGSRVEDSFLLQGGALNDAKRALQLEGELLDDCNCRVRAAWIDPASRKD